MATITGESLPGAILGDDVGITGGTAAFSSAGAGAGITVDISGLTLTGATAGNYSITGTATTTANINAAPLTVTPVTPTTRRSRSAAPCIAIICTASYSGFVNGETLAASDVTGDPSLSTTATSSGALPGSVPDHGDAGDIGLHHLAPFHSSTGR